MAYWHLPWSFSTVSEDTARSNTLHMLMGHGKCILSILLQKYCIIELEMSPHIFSRPWNFKITHKNKIQSVFQLCCWYPFPQLQILFMEVFRQSVMLCKGSRVCICPQPFCPPLLWHLREGHAPSIKGASLLFETRRAWGLYFTGLKALWKSSLGEAAVRKKKNATDKISVLKIENKQSNEKHCRRIHW